MEAQQERAPLDRTFIALADPTRRKILDRLSRGEARVTEVAAKFPISLNSVSKHIKMLERAQLIERRIIGRDHILRLSTAPLTAIQDWLEHKQAFWAAQLKALDEFLTKEQQEKG